MGNPLYCKTHVSLNGLVATLAALVCGSLSSLHAGSISAYRDTAGRVIFVNEQVADFSSAAVPTPATSAAPDTSKPLSSDGGPVSATAPVSTPVVETRQVSSPLPEGPGEARFAAPGIRSAWDDMIEGTASRHSVDPALVRAIVQVESNFNPFAISSRGARGLMQLVPATARRFGVRNVFDPKSNLDGGVRYLKYLMNLFDGDLKLSLAAYNAGENAVDRHKGVPPFVETQDYLRKIFEIYPLSSSRGVIAATRIAKYVDSNGIIHFSNTDLP